MVEDARAVSQLLHHTAPSFESLDGAALRAQAEDHHRRRGRRRLLPAAAAASVIAFAVAVSLITHHTSSKPDAARPPSTPPPTHNAPNQTGSQTRVADGTVRVNLVLPATTFPADGQPIHAQLTVINGTGRGVVIKNACDGWVNAGLSGGPVTFEPASGLVGCASKTIAPGTTVIHTTIRTTFTQCQQGKQQGTADMPHCLGPNDSNLPNLPPGTYWAEVKTQSTSVAPVLSSPQKVRLTAPH